MPAAVPPDEHNFVPPPPSDAIRADRCAHPPACASDQFVIRDFGLGVVRVRFVGHGDSCSGENGVHATRRPRGRPKREVNQRRDIIPQRKKNKSVRAELGVFSEPAVPETLDRRHQGNAVDRLICRDAAKRETCQRPIRDVFARRRHQSGAADRYRCGRRSSASEPTSVCSRLITKSWRRMWASSCARMASSWAIGMLVTRLTGSSTTGRR